MTPNARSANSTAVGSALTKRLSGPLECADASVPVDPREPAFAGPRRPSAKEDRAAATTALGVVCPDCPDVPDAGRPAAVSPPGRRVEPSLARTRVPDADPPATEGAADCEIGAADAVDAEGDAPRDGSSRSVPAEVLAVGIRTGPVGSDGVVTDGVATVGVLACGVVIGPTVTGGTVTDGTLTVGTLTVGLVTVGTLTVRSDTVGTSAPRAPAGATALTPQTASTASEQRPSSQFATRVEVEHRLRTGPSTHDRKTASRDYTSAPSPRPNARTPCRRCQMVSRSSIRQSRVRTRRLGSS
jgi:hypothetical protein